MPESCSAKLSVVRCAVSNENFQPCGFDTFDLLIFSLRDYTPEPLKPRDK